MGKVILVAIVAFLAVTLLLVALLLFAKAKLTSSGKVSIDINDGKKVVEVEAGGARELDVLVASPNLEKAPLAYWFEKTAVGFVVMGDLIGEYMD